MKCLNLIISWYFKINICNYDRVFLFYITFSIKCKPVLKQKLSTGVRTVQTSLKKAGTRLFTFERTSSPTPVPKLRVFFSFSWPNNFESNCETLPLVMTPLAFSGLMFLIFLQTTALPSKNGKKHRISSLFLPFCFLL